MTVSIYDSAFKSSFLFGKKQNQTPPNLTAGDVQGNLGSCCAGCPFAGRLPASRWKNC